MMKKRILKIGIASREKQRERMRAIVRGELKPKKRDPKVWFTSIESVAQVLSTKNVLLLEMIMHSKPASLSELAELSGREKSNLSRTLRTMAQYGIVKLEKLNRKIKPKVEFSAFNVKLAA